MFRWLECWRSDFGGMSVGEVSLGDLSVGEVSLGGMSVGEVILVT